MRKNVQNTSVRFIRHFVRFFARFFPCYRTFYRFDSFHAFTRRCSGRTCFPSMTFVHHQSCECLKSELDIFTIQPMQRSIAGGQWIEHQPTTSLDSGGPIEFTIPGTGDAYIALANTYLFVRAKAVRRAGTNFADDAPLHPSTIGSTRYSAMLTYTSTTRS